MGGSLLPITLINGKIHLLFGKEREYDENPGWSDFGGGTDGNESYLETAIREGGEELTGFLGNSSDIRRMLAKYGTYKINFKNEGYPNYRVHIFPIEYNPYLEIYYNNNQKFLQKRLDKKILRNTKIFEKTQIKWFSFEELEINKKEFRNFYQNIIDLILSNKNSIIRFLNKTYNSYNVKSRRKKKANKIKNKTFKKKNN